MISLRLSAEEYLALIKVYQRFGARNVSDFARLAMQRAIGQPLPVDSASLSRTLEFDERLTALEAKFALLLSQRQNQEQLPQ
jgi:hypothetical protein